MKANELRLGNIVKFSYLQGTILTIKDNVCEVIADTIIAKLDYDDIEPITLTEEWLLKFGFKTSAWDNHSTYRKMIGNNDYTIVFDEYSNTMIGDIMIKEIKYVHQLQNLYFALIGEELSVKTDLVS
jgi:hypothetical protein